MTRSPSRKAASSRRASVLVMAAVAAASIPCVSLGQTARPSMNGGVKTGSTFACEGGRELFAEFSTRGSDMVAIVDAGDGPHVLKLRPWSGGVAQITWSDGRRSLTWSTGVQLHFMDGATHLNCGRGGHKH